MSNLQEFHHFEEAPDVKSRTWVAIVIAVIMAGFGVYAFMRRSGVPWCRRSLPVLDNQLPALLTRAQTQD